MERGATIPLFEFQCNECGLRFEKFRRQRPDETPCPSCGKAAGQIPSAPGVTWQVGDPEYVDHQIGRIEPENIGVSAIDHSVDRITGQRSRELWASIQGRQDEKMDVIRGNPGATGHDLSIIPEGGYRLMESRERKIKDYVREGHRRKLQELARQRNRENHI